MPRVSETTTAGQASLVLIWCRTEPDRVGQRVVVGAAPRTLGRDRRGPSAVWPAWWRGSTPFEARPLSSPHLSADQLALAVSPGGVWIRRLGRRLVRVDGEAMDEAVAPPGSIVEVDRELALWVDPAPLGGPIDDPLPPGAVDRDGWIGESAAAWQTRRQLAAAAAAPRHTWLIGRDAAPLESLASALARRSGRPLWGPGELGAAPPGAWWLTRAPREATPPRPDLLALHLAERDEAPREAARVEVADLDARRADRPLIARHRLQERAARDPQALSPYLDERGEVRVTLAFAVELQRRAFDAEGLADWLDQSIDRSTGKALEVPSDATGLRRAAWEEDFT